ncbi:hypothetical protein NN761_04175 [Bacteroides clarus]|uniref:hypothetical protein n=1 Tax=Bacteroides clarus TaxID=626929 RepID=UPI00210184C2|nr:hypothetical protein [Bacteroides clarus]MCQ1544768.1 hypothetical protein [Bacteroides clarus]
MQPQQTANNTQRLMKRRSNGISLRPHFFFSHPFVGRHAFVERLFRAYFAIYQDVIYQFQQFNAFLPLNKSAGKATEVNTAIRRLVGRTSILPTDKVKPMLLAKRKRRPTTADITATPPQAFGEQKAIAH